MRKNQILPEPLFCTSVENMLSERCIEEIIAEQEAGQRPLFHVVVEREYAHGGTVASVAKIVELEYASK